MASTLTNLLYHVVFSTKGRLPLISEEISPRLYAYMGGIIREHGGVAIEIGGITDHVHVLMRIKAIVPLANMVRLIKAGSSKWVSDHFSEKHPFAWQVGYGAFTVSESMLSRVQIYIQNQKMHHEKQSFTDEYRFFLNKHCISYDPKYILD